jgi:RNA polymerase sigma factor (sigma-70 family)
MTAQALDLQIRHLIPAAAAGDRSAYGRVVAACQNTVTAIALAIVRDVHTSQDIAQDAFLTAWQKLARLKNPDSFLPWLRQITRNLARDHLRAQRRHGLPVDDAEAAIAQVADPRPCPADQQVQLEEAEAAAAAIDALPEESREVLLLYYREGQSSQQVATLLGLSDAAVRKRLSRARQAIRDEMLARLGEFARSSAPSAAFTAVVTAALTVASPQAAAASILVAGAATAGKSFGKLLLGSFGSIVIGLGAAFAGIYWGLKCQLRGAIDATERQALTRSALVNAAATVAFLFGILATTAWTEGWLPPVLVAIVFMSIITWQCSVTQPRAMARRHAIEMQRDPEVALRKRRRERLTAWLGFLTGLVLGGGGLIYGLIASGRAAF